MECHKGFDHCVFLSLLGGLHWLVSPGVRTLSNPAAELSMICHRFLRRRRRSNRIWPPPFLRTGRGWRSSWTPCRTGQSRIDGLHRPRCLWHVLLWRLKHECRVPVHSVAPMPQQQGVRVAALLAFDAIMWRMVITDNGVWFLRVTHIILSLCLTLLLSMAQIWWKFHIHSGRHGKIDRPIRDFTCGAIACLWELRRISSRSLKTGLLP